jgi:hypothetical protein
MRQHNLPITIAAVLLLAAGLRIAGMFGDLWLDEIWGWGIAQDLDSPAEILSNDNRVHPNQPLNTFLIYIMGRHEWWPIYRVPSVLLGIGTIALAGVWAARRSRAEMIAVMLVAAVSYPMVFYSSELRGYAPAIFFMLAAIIAIERHARGPRWAAIFAACVILGSMAHLLFIPLYGMLGLWSLIKFARELPRRSAITTAAAYHVGPALFQAWYYFAFVRGQIGSSDVSTLPDALLATAALVWGGPRRGIIAILAALFIIAAALYGIWRLWREGSDWWILFTLVIFVSPIVIITRAAITNELMLLSPRHLLASVVMMVLLIGLMIGDVFRRGGRAPALAAAAMLLFLAGNLLETTQFIRHGRGQYLAATRYMVEHTPGPVVRISADHPLRAGMLVRFYAPYAVGHKRLEFIAVRDEWGPVPDWMIGHSPLPGQPINPDPLDLGGDWHFRRVAVFPHHGLSGFTWEIYRRTDRPR